jgi:hypothetical protein
MSHSSLAVLVIIGMQAASGAGVSSPIQSDLAADDFVELRRTGCFGACPQYTVRVYADGRVFWTATGYVHTVGAVGATVAPQEARALIETIRTSGFWDLRDRYVRQMSDLPSAITTLHVGAREKSVINHGSFAPPRLQELEIAIDVAANTHQWVHGDPRIEPMTYMAIHSDGAGGKPGVTMLMQAAIRADVDGIRRRLNEDKVDPNARERERSHGIRHTRAGVPPLHDGHDGRRDAVSAAPVRTAAQPTCPGAVSAPERSERKNDPNVPNDPNDPNVPNVPNDPNDVIRSSPLDEPCGRPRASAPR